jgi:hypothetical protein
VIAGELVRPFSSFAVLWHLDNFDWYLQNIKLQDDFGFAPSTLLYHGTDTPATKARI